MNESIFTIVILFLLGSCKVNQEVITANGVWQQLGYGKILEIKNDSVKVYDICAIDCTLYEQTLLADEGEVVKFTADSLVIKKNIKSYRFTRLQQLPPLCQDINLKALSPEHNFEVLWTTFNENYCYFEERNIDWNYTYNLYKSRITNATTQLELFTLFDTMLSDMNDGHVSMDVPKSLEDALSEVKENNENQNNQEEVKQLIDQFKLSDLIADQYCKDCQTYNAGIVKWGFLNPEIAYLQVNAMWLMANYDIPKNLSIREFGAHYVPIMNERTFQRQDEIDGASELMNSVFTDLQDSKALIIDLRFNQGGKDEVGLEIIGHLVKNKVQIASKKARLGDTFTNHQNIYIESRLPFYNKPAYILTSVMTGSAAELATLATFPIKNVMRLGSNTEGIFSDGLDKKLPIGWEYTLSNEIYMALDGKSYEDIGIPPQIDLGYPRNKVEFLNLVFTQLLGAGDSAIEKVFQLENSRN